MAKRIVGDLKNSEALAVEPVARNTKTVAVQSRDNQKVYSSNVTFLGNNNSSFQLGQNTRTISGFIFGRTS